MMEKRIYMNEEELRDMEIRMANDYVGEIVSARWVNYLGVYEVRVEFYSREELKLFCEMYGYKITGVGGFGLLIKVEAE